MLLGQLIVAVLAAVKRFDAGVFQTVRGMLGSLRSRGEGLAE